MRKKTYPTVERQWDKTVALFHGYDGPDAEGYGQSYGWHLGLIVRPHLHVVIGDFCLFIIDHGCADRWRTWCFTSKGHAVSGMYLMYQRWQYDFAEKHFEKIRHDKAGIATCIELPSDLAGTQPDHTGVRSFVVEELAHERFRKPVSANSRHKGG